MANEDESHNQHRRSAYLTLLSSKRAQEWLCPREIEVAVRPVPRSTDGKSSPISSASSPMVSMWPRPSCPLRLSPQHCCVVISLIRQEDKQHSRIGDEREEWGEGERVLTIAMRKKQRGLCDTCLFLFLFHYSNALD